MVGWSNAVVVMDREQKQEEEHHNEGQQISNVSM